MPTAAEEVGRHPHSTESRLITVQDMSPTRTPFRCRRFRDQIQGKELSCVDLFHSLHKAPSPAAPFEVEATGPDTTRAELVLNVPLVLEHSARCCNNNHDRAEQPPDELSLSNCQARTGKRGSQVTAM